jgi:hypothetical protein
LGSQQFSIQQNIFEIDTADRENVHQLQNRISKLVNDRLTERMKEYFEKIIPEDQLLTIEQLSYDIGEVSWDDMEDEIEERFMRALEDDLSARLYLLQQPDSNTASGIRSSGILASKSALLEYFLLTGTMPWWAGSFAVVNLEDVLDDFYEDDRDGLKEMLLRSGKKEQVRIRIVNQFSEKAIQKIIKAVAYTEAEYIFQSQKEIVEVEKERQLVKTSLTEFSKAVWLFILNYLLAEQGSNFSKKMFIKSNLIQLAATYNISFHDVLHVFYDALEQEANPKKYESLKVFIKEIVEEETVVITPQHLQEQQTINQGKDAKDIKAVNELQLLQYYLDSASLPYVYERLSSKELSDIFLNAARAFPAEARRIMLDRTGRRSGAFEYLYKLLGATGVKKLFSIIFPREERRISEIAAILQALQISSPFVPLTSSELNTIVWQFFFDATVLSIDSGFSEEAILITVTDRLESEYGAGRFTTWHLLARSLEAAAGSSMQHQQAFRTVQEIVIAKIKKDTGAGVNDRTVTQLQGQILYPYENEMPVSYHPKKLNDVLRYLLQYGSVPWWGEEFYHRPVADMMLELHRNNKQALLIIFRQSMQSQQMKKRFLDNIPAEIIDEVLYELPYGKDALLYVTGFSSLLEKAAMMKYYSTSFIQKSLFAIAVDLLTGTGYALFSGTAFYQEAVLRLSGFLKITPGEFTLRIIEAAVNNTDGTNSSDNQLLVLRSTAIIFKIEVAAKDALISLQNLIHRVTIDLSTAEQDNSQSAAIAVLQKLLPGNTITGEKGIAFVSTLLEYFLTWHRFPDSVKQLDENEQARLLKILITYLYREDKNRLTNIFSKPAVSGIAAVYSIELFANHKDILENEIYIYLLQISQISKQVQDHDKPALFAFQQAEAIEQEHAFSLEDFFIGDENYESHGSMSTTLIHKQSLQILEYFLRYNKLPDSITVGSVWKMNLLLKEIIVFLFNNDPSFIQQSFDRQDISIEAKLHLYDLFAISSDIVTDKISRLMDVKRENDFIQFLLTSADIPHLINKDTISEFVESYLQSEWKIKKQDSIAWLMASPSFAKIVLEKGGITALLKFAEHQVSWSYTGTSVIQVWYTLILQGISSSYDRERVTELFKRFNINFISGYLSIKRDEEYSIAFLEFLAEYLRGAAMLIFKMLFEFMAVAGNNAAVLQTEQGKKIMLQLRQKVLKQEEQQYIHSRLDETNKEFTAITKKEEEMLPAQQHENDKKKQEDRAKAEEEEKELLKENKNGFYIRNAGLILFHPFIETFFTRTGLMEKRKFISDETRNRAVLLLQYLASGKTEQEEHELVLNKILCGVPLTEPVPVRFVPTQQETDTCAELFKVIIERWPKMANASVDGMRASLILRNGVIKLTEEDGWYMRVEQRGYDIILQTLPWAFGFVKLAWMDKPITTEWI